MCALGTSLLTVISKRTKGNLFECTYFYWEPVFIATNSQEIWFPEVPLEYFVKNKVRSENILAGALYLIVIPRGTKGKHILLRIS
jgi:hypothetical protein